MAQTDSATPSPPLTVCAFLWEKHNNLLQNVDKWLEINKGLVGHVHGPTEKVRRALGKIKDPYLLYRFVRSGLLQHYKPAEGGLGIHYSVLRTLKAQYSDRIGLVGRLAVFLDDSVKEVLALTEEDIDDTHSDVKSVISIYLDCYCDLVSSFFDDLSEEEQYEDSIELIDDEESIEDIQEEEESIEVIDDDPLTQESSGESDTDKEEDDCDPEEDDDIYDEESDDWIVNCPI